MSCSNVRGARKVKKIRRYYWLGWLSNHCMHCRPYCLRVTFRLYVRRLTLWAHLHIQLLRHSFAYYFIQNAMHCHRFYWVQNASFELLSSKNNFFALKVLKYLIMLISKFIFSLFGYLHQILLPTCFFFFFRAGFLNTL